MPIVLSTSSQSDAGLINYGDLKTQVALWLNRTDLEDNIPEFVRLAESRIRTDIKTRANEDSTAGTLTSEALSLPSQMIEARKFVVNDVELAYVTPDQFTRLERKGTSRPCKYYTIKGQNAHILKGADGDEFSLDYWAWFDYFVNDTDTNWLLLNSPDVYLWASCEAGCIYLKDYEAAQGFSNKYDEAVAKVTRKEQEYRFSGAPLTVRTDVVER